MKQPQLTPSPSPCLHLLPLEASESNQLQVRTGSPQAAVSSDGICMLETPAAMPRQLVNVAHTQRRTELHPTYGCRGVY